MKSHIFAVAAEFLFEPLHTFPLPCQVERPRFCLLGDHKPGPIFIPPGVQTLMATDWSVVCVQA